MLVKSTLVPLAFTAVPATIALFTLLTTAVPVPTGRLIVLLPAIAGSCNVILPLVEPTKTIDIYFPYKTTQR